MKREEIAIRKISLSTLELEKEYKRVTEDESKRYNMFKKNYNPKK